MSDDGVPRYGQIANANPERGKDRVADRGGDDVALALGALIGALGDPDPAILIPALESLQWVANSSAI